MPVTQLGLRPEKEILDHEYVRQFSPSVIENVTKPELYATTQTSMPDLQADDHDSFNKFFPEEASLQVPINPYSFNDSTLGEAYSSNLNQKSKSNNPKLSSFPNKNQPLLYIQKLQTPTKKLYF